MFKLEKLVRKNILSLTPYSSARDEFTGKAEVYLDANENSLGSPMLTWYNRYPDPHQWAVKHKLSAIKHVPAEHIFMGNGSDECIDLLYRCFCNPGMDNVIITPPTYGMYKVSAQINDVECREAPLTLDYQLDIHTIQNLIDSNTKIIWICSPNNPTGNSMHRMDIETILNNFDGLVVVDEAYINFSKQKSFVAELSNYPNLVVLQTLSKAWGLAGLRVGMLYAAAGIVEVLNKVKPPYNIGEHTQKMVLTALDNVDQVNDMIHLIVAMRDALAEVLLEAPIVQQVYESDANFLLVKILEAHKVYEYLLSKSIVVRDRSNVALCNDCLRITIGTEEENTALIDALAAYMDELEEKVQNA